MVDGIYYLGLARSEEFTTALNLARKVPFSKKFLNEGTHLFLPVKNGAEKVVFQILAGGKRSVSLKSSWQKAKLQTGGRKLELVGNVSVKVLELHPLQSIWCEYT